MREDIPLAQAGRDVSEPAGNGSAQLRWDAFYAVILAAAVAVVATSGLPTERRTVAIMALAALIPWYVFVGRPEMRASEAPRNSRRGLIYLAGAVALFIVAQWQDNNSWLLAWALCPQFFEVARFFRAMGAVTVLNLSAALIVIFQSSSLAPRIAALALATFGIGFSLVYVGWVTRIMAQSNERAELIKQLESTRAELAAANREAGMLAERQRLAGEIHDTLAQGFSSIIMLVQAAEGQLERDPPQARRHLGRAARTARENLAEARAMVAALTSARLHATSLDDALRRLTEDVGAELGIDARFDVAGPSRPLPPNIEVMLLRVGQEALANVRKHACAQAVSVALRYGDQRVRLEVGDDGGGFDPERVNGGYGLRGMRDRAREADGTLRVRSQVGAGTRVVVE
ncbi:MAG TPA: sensor histidine kinase, partial [Streptosporangiaceae bacterium]